MMLIDIIDAKTGLSVRDDRSAGTIELVRCLYADRNLDVDRLIKAEDYIELAGLINEPADILLIAADKDLSSGHLINYVQFFRRVRVIPHSSSEGRCARKPAKP